MPIPVPGPCAWRNISGLALAPFSNVDGKVVGYRPQHTSRFETSFLLCRHIDPFYGRDIWLLKLVPEVMYGPKYFKSRNV